ncbi:MAG TPA: hypothetical protein VFC44_06160 [Candidatus Saccharimonadales bacterium]|nr:hypothetical protein [Candidatus Saccharimonadales bacterium]
MKAVNQTLLDGGGFRWRQVRRSLTGAIVLLLWDVVLTGSFLMSLMVCPVWLLISLIRSLWSRPGWKLAGIKAAIPVVTLGVVFANASFQARIEDGNAGRIIKAAEQYRSATGNYPDTLNDLVPKYLSLVPPAKYCLMHSDGFRYSHHNSAGLFMEEDFTNLPALARRLSDRSDEVSACLADQMILAAKECLDSYNPSNTNGRQLKTALVQELNNVDLSRFVYRKTNIANVTLRPETVELRRKHPAPNTAEGRMLQRLFLEDVYPRALSRDHTSGGRDSHFMFWTVIPPFGRKTYDFESKAFGYVD